MIIQESPKLRQFPSFPCLENRTDGKANLFLTANFNAVSGLAFGMLAGTPTQPLQPDGADLRTTQQPVLRQTPELQPEQCEMHGNPALLL